MTRPAERPSVASHLIGALAAGLVACGSSGTEVDQFAIPVDMSTGPVLVDLDTSEDERFSAVVDTLSPLTIIDSFRDGGEVATPRRRQLDITLYATDGSANPVPRARYTTADVLDIHPCPIEVSDPDNPPAQQECAIGADGSQRTINGVLGADLLSRKAVRFDFDASTMSFFPDIAGNDAARGRACDAVFSSPFHGGGTLRLSGAEVSFSGKRIALGACLAFDESDGINDIERGVDALFLVSTGLGTTIISESTYDRYQAFVPTAPALDSLPTETIHLIAGSVSARRGAISQVALVGEEADDRGPCKEMYANHFMAKDGCNAADFTGECPCSQASFCRTAAVIELSDDGVDGDQIDVWIIADSHPLLQELRDELRPGLPEIDGILGTDALSSVSMDIDYPNNRVVARCTDPDRLVCATRPKVLTVSTASQVNSCAQFGVPDPVGQL